MKRSSAKPATPCLICGYELAGIPEGGSCPECGAPTTQADGALFKQAEPEYLQQLTRGSRLALLAAWLRLSLLVLDAIVMRLLPAQFDEFSAASVLYGLLNLAVAVIAAVGWWRIAAPPPWAARDTMETRRRFLRLMVVAFLAVNIIMTVAGQIRSVTVMVEPTGASTDPVEALMSALAALAGLVFILTYIAGVRFLAPFCERLGDQRLYKKARRLRWTIPLAFVTLAVLASLSAIYLPRAPEFLLELVVFPGLYWFVWVRFLGLLHRRVRSLAAQSQATRPTVARDTSTTEPPAP